MPSKTNETKKGALKETQKNSKSSTVKREKKNEKEIVTQSKKNSTAKEFAVKVAETIKEASKKIISSKPKAEDTKKEVAKKSASPKTKKTTSKDTTVSKTTASKSIDSKRTTKPKEKPSTEKEAKTTSKTKSTSNTSTKRKKDINISKTKTSKNSYKNKTVKTPKTTAVKTEKKSEPVTVLEHYDLPYRYNETIVRILYQTPNTLFVYWDISDKDRENYIKQFGEDFFNITYPVLIVHNDTMNYSFEVIINDFANSWYLRVNDSKCHYRVELGRKLINHFDINETEELSVDNTDDKSAENQAEIIKAKINYIKNIKEKFKNDYMFVSTSNSIELPNDHILFKTNENNTIKYRNVKTKQETNISLYDIIKNIPLIDKTELPYISSEILEGLYTAIYKNDDLSVLATLSNPSSGGLSSSRMPHS